MYIFINYNKENTLSIIKNIMETLKIDFFESICFYTIEMNIIMGT